MEGPVASMHQSQDARDVRVYSLTFVPGAPWDLVSGTPARRGWAQGFPPKAARLGEKGSGSPWVKVLTWGTGFGAI